MTKKKSLNIQNKGCYTENDLLIKMQYSYSSKLINIIVSANLIRK